MEAPACDVHTSSSVCVQIPIVCKPKPHLPLLVMRSCLSDQTYIPGLWTRLPQPPLTGRRDQRQRLAQALVVGVGSLQQEMPSSGDLKQSLEGATGSGAHISWQLGVL